MSHLPFSNVMGRRALSDVVFPALDKRAEVGSNGDEREAEYEADQGGECQLPSHHHSRKKKLGMAMNMK